MVVAPSLAFSQPPGPAQNNGRALLHSDGGTLLNENPAPEVSTLFVDDRVENQPGHSSKIEIAGSSVLVREETLVQFKDNEVVLEHGRLQLSTASAMRVRVGCIIVIPITSERTQYDVIDVDGKVQVAAFKNDVRIHHNGAILRGAKSDSGDLIVHEGEEKSRSEKCAGADLPPADLNGAILDSKWAEAAGIVAVGVITCFGLCHSDDPASPWKP